MTANTPLRIGCVMLSRRQGGLEQALLDTSEALASVGEQPVAIIDPAWPGRPLLEGLRVEQASLATLGEWDRLAALRLRRLLQRYRVDVALTIGRRASVVTRRALAHPRPLRQIALAPNERVLPLIGLDHVVAPTTAIARALVAAGQSPERVSVVPHLVRVPPEVTPRPPGAVPVIGALGRLAPEKGFEVLIRALAGLRERGHGFEARVGGSGPEENALRRLAARHGLLDDLRFVGWVTDKSAFFGGLDVLCVPSLCEAFGIVVLEGLAHARATVVSDAAGPAEIVTDRVDGLIVPRGEPRPLAEALSELLLDRALRQRLARAGQATARARYDLPVVARQLAGVLHRLAGRDATREFG